MQPDFPTPKIIISRCIGFEACRYNGDIISDEPIRDLLPHVESLTVCPEMAMGMGVPRPTVRLERHEGAIRMIQPVSGRDFTEEMEAFSQGFATAHADVDGAILAYKSPSCGPSQVKIYESGRITKGMGLFAKALMKHLPHLPIEDEGRLKNAYIREHFLIKLFCLARFRAVCATGEIDALRAFHEHNKYLMMAYHPALQKRLGQIVANHEKNPLPTLFAAYAEAFAKLMQATPSKGKMINALSHIAGYFSKSGTPEEKAFLQESFALYRGDQIPLRSILYLIHGWALREHNAYLLTQTLLQPYPKALMSMKDSGRVIEM